MTNRLPSVVRHLGDVPPAMRKYYDRRENDWVLALAGTPDGCVPEAEVVAAKQARRELRDANIGMAKALKQVLGIDVSEITALPEAIHMFSETTAIDRAIENALGPLQDAADSLARDVARSTEERLATEALLRRSEFRAQLIDVGMKAGVQPAMLEPFVSYVVSTACDSDGTFSPKTAAGATIFSKRNIVAAIDVGEWISEQVLVVPGFFKTSVVAEAKRRQDDGTST